MNIYNLQKEKERWGGDCGPGTAADLEQRKAAK